MKYRVTNELTTNLLVITNESHFYISDHSGESSKDIKTKL